MNKWPLILALLCASAAADKPVKPDPPKKPAPCDPAKVGCVKEPKGMDGGK